MDRFAFSLLSLDTARDCRGGAFDARFDGSSGFRFQIIGSIAARVHYTFTHSVEIQTLLRCWEKLRFRTEVRSRAKPSLRLIPADRPRSRALH